MLSRFKIFGAIFVAFSAFGLAHGQDLPQVKLPPFPESGLFKYGGPKAGAICKTNGDVVHGDNGAPLVCNKGYLQEASHFEQDNEGCFYAVLAQSGKRVLMKNLAGQPSCTKPKL